MKLPRLLVPFAGAGVALWLTCVLALPAQEPPPPRPAEPPAAEAPAAEAPEPPPAPEADAEKADEAPLRRLDTVEQEASPAADTGRAEKQAEESRRDPGLQFSVQGHRGEVVRFGTDILLPSDQSANQVVAIFGSIIADGPIRGEAVAIMGDVTVNHSSNETVAIMGNVIVNGTVHGEIVAVMGNVQLGPNAVVNGEIVCIGGRIDRAPGAVVNGGVQHIGPFPVVGDGLPGLRIWFQKCLLLLRPLAFDERVGWAWGIAAAFLGIYLLIALLFNRSVIACAETLEQRPGATVGIALLTALLAPVLSVLLAFIGVGFVLMLVLMIMGLFGKAAFLAWMGRRITQPLGWTHSVGPVLVGGVILLLLYTIPFAGFLVMKLTSALGLGMVVYATMLAVRRERGVLPPSAPAAPGAAVPPGVPPPMPGVPAAPTGASGFAAPAQPAAATQPEVTLSDPEAATGAPGVSPAPVVPPAPSYAEPPPLTPPVPPVPTQYSTLPRAGFWIRIAASVIDVILVGVVLNMINVEDYFPLLFAAYCIVLWTLRGTTIGGIICNLKVVRLDDRKIDWSIALVRALGGFLSLAVVGLGFVWVAFDKDRQSWHDKIAGTTIVHVPKGVTLV